MKLQYLPGSGVSARLLQEAFLIRRDLIPDFCHHPPPSRLIIFANVFNSFPFRKEQFIQRS